MSAISSSLLHHSYNVTDLTSCVLDYDELSIRCALTNSDCSFSALLICCLGRHFTANHLRFAAAEFC